MHSGSSLSPDTDTSDCAFCQRGRIARYILKETSTFRILADYAPVVPGHLLIVPRHHYTCYGDVPATLDADLLYLKQEVQRFFTRFYTPAVFWEHGIFRQTVFHAHLHCFPFGEANYSPSTDLHERVARSQDDIRAWHATKGAYFYLEDIHHAFLFAPNVDHYWQVIQTALWAGIANRGPHGGLRSVLQRQDEGIPLIEELQAKWQQFQN